MRVCVRARRREGGRERKGERGRECAQSLQCSGGTRLRSGLPEILVGRTQVSVWSSGRSRGRAAARSSNDNQQRAVGSFIRLLPGARFRRTAGAAIGACSQFQEMQAPAVASEQKRRGRQGP